MTTENKGKLVGKSVEKVFFGDAKAQLEAFWKLGSLGELGSATQIELPEKAFVYVQTKRDESDLTGKEYGAVLGFDANGVNIYNERESRKSIRDFVGNSFVNTMELSVEYGNIVETSVGRFFKKTDPILFHTHVTLGENDIKSAQIGLSDGTTLKISKEAITKYVSYQIEGFSSADLDNLFSGNRETASLLLSTPTRTIYVAPPELFVNKGYTKFSKFLKEYEDRILTLDLAASISLLGLEPDFYFDSLKKSQKRIFLKIIDDAKYIARGKPDLAKLMDMKDAILVKIMNSAGFSVFASEGNDTKVLKRLKILSLS